MSNRTKIHTQYYTKDGKRVPGATTVAKLISESGGLIHWAWDLGTQGLDYRKVRDQEASVGTITHYLIRCHLKKMIPDLKDYAPSDVKRANVSLKSFKDFEKTHKMKTLLSEKPLVSEKYKFGGTLDWYGKFDNQLILALMDFKSGKRIYPDMRLQVAGYKQLLIEHGYKVKDVCLFQPKKDVPDEFTYYKLGDLEDEWKLFKLLLKAYPLKREIWKK